MTGINQSGDKDSLEPIILDSMDSDSVDGGDGVDEVNQHTDADVVFSFGERIVASFPKEGGLRVSIPTNGNRQKV